MKKILREVGGVLKSDFKRNINKISIICVLIFLVICASLLQMGISSYSEIVKKRTEFVEFEKRKLNRYVNNVQYGLYGIRVLIESSPICAFYFNSNSFDDLEVFMDCSVRLRINKPQIDANIFEKPTSGSLDFSWFLLIFFSGMILAWGFFTFRFSGNYLRFLHSFASTGTIYTGIFLSRALLLFLVLLLELFISIVIFFCNKINILPEITGILIFLFAAYGVMIFFLVLGFILGTVKSKAKAVITAVLSWLIIVLLWSEVLNTVFSKKAENNMISRYRLEIQKIEILTEYEKLIREKAKELKTKTERIELNQRFTGQYLNEGFKQIEALEIDMIDSIRENAEEFQLWSIFNPVTFYKSVNNELSSMGYNEYLRFYRYSLDKFKGFVLYYFDNILYKKNPKVVSYLKDDEFVFKAKPSLPKYFGTGLILNFGYILILLFFSYHRFKKVLFPKPENKEAFKELDFKYTSGKHISYFCKNKDFSNQVFNVFMGMGKARKYSGKISIDGNDIVTDEKQDFVYLPDQDVMPQNIKTKSLLDFVCKVLKIPAEEQNKIKEDLAQIMDKKFSDLNDLEKVELMLKIAALKNSKIYIFNNFSLYFPPKVLNKIFEGLKDKLVIEFTSVSLMHSNYYYYSVITLEDSLYEEDKIGI